MAHQAGDCRSVNAIAGFRADRLHCFGSELARLKNRFLLGRAVSNRPTWRPAIEQHGRIAPVLLPMLLSTGCPGAFQTSSNASRSSSINVSSWERRWRNAQPLRATRHCRIVDRLDVDAVHVHQAVGRLLAELGVADQHRNDVCHGRHDRQAGFEQDILCALSLALMLFAFDLRGFQMADRRGRRGRHCRRQAPW